MNKKVIWLIIAVMSAAMVGISGIQVYWIKWSLELDAKKFDERVYSTLKKVSDYIEHFDIEREEKANIFSGTRERPSLLDQSEFRLSMTDSITFAPPTMPSHSGIRSSSVMSNRSRLGEQQ